MSVLEAPFRPVFSTSLPSTSKVLYSTRPPFTLYFTLPTTPTLASSCPVWLLTPGASAINCVKFLPFSPMLTTSFCVIVPETVEVSTSTFPTPLDSTFTSVFALCGSRGASKVD